EAFSVSSPVTRSAPIPRRGEWAFEVEWDGFRAAPLRTDAEAPSGHSGDVHDLRPAQPRGSQRAQRAVCEAGVELEALDLNGVRWQTPGEAPFWRVSRVAGFLAHRLHLDHDHVALRVAHVLDRMRRERVGPQRGAWLRSLVRPSSVEQHATLAVAADEVR